MKKLLINVALLLIGFAAGYGYLWWGNQPAAPVDGQSILARVGDQVITTEDFIAEMERRGGHKPGQYQTREQKQALLDTMLDRLKMLAIAKQLNLQNKPAVKWAMERVLIAKLQEQEIDNKLRNVDVSEQEIEQWYEQHQDDYAVPEQVKLAVIVLPVDPKQGVQGWADARKNADIIIGRLSELDSNQFDFGKLAEEFSAHRGSRYMGGAIDWLTNHPSQIKYSRWPVEMQKAGFELKQPGDYRVVEVEDKGIYLIRLIERRESKPRSLDKVRSGLVYKLKRDKQERIRQDLYTNLLDSKIAIDQWPERLDQIKPLSAAEKPKRGPQPLPGAGGAE